MVEWRRSDLRRHAGRETGGLCATWRGSAARARMVAAAAAGPLRGQPGQLSVGGSGVALPKTPGGSAPWLAAEPPAVGQMRGVHP